MTDLLTLPPRTKIDWETYYKEQFKPLHGGDPVEHEGKILFRDGWQYSIESYKGPEYPPPEDPWAVHWLKVAYWERLKKQRETILASTEQALRYLEDLQRTHCCDIQTVTTFRDPDTNRIAKHKGTVDLEGYHSRVQLQRKGVEEATAMLDELGKRNA